LLNSPQDVGAVVLSAARAAEVLGLTSLPAPEPRHAYLVLGP